MTENLIETKLPTKNTKRTHWSWFPSLLFGDGLNMSVIVMSLIMMRRFGLNNAQITFYAAIIGIPFILRPLLEMAVTFFRGTTKVWILSAEFISALSLWATAFTLPTNYWLQGTMCFLPFFVFSAIFNNIALERFYLDLPSKGTPHQEVLSILFRCMAILFGIGTVSMLAGNMEVVTRNIRYSWSFVFYIMAGIEFFLWLWHSIFLPGGLRQCITDKDLFGLNTKDYNIVVNMVTNGFKNRFMLYFIMLSMLPEALMSPILLLFMIDAPHNGGLGLSPQEFGLSVGTIGITTLFVGLRFGAYIIKRFGLHKCTLPMAMSMAVLGASMLYLSYNPASSLATICLSVLTGFLMFGFGLSAYTANVEFFANKAPGAVFRKAIALSLMSLVMVMVSVFSGLIQTNVGYRQFFTISLAMNAVPIIMAIVYTIMRRKENTLL